jgi:glycosyltransferase involved in cell wall biosynthesis
MEGVVPESKWRVLYNGLDLHDFRASEELRSSFRARHGLADCLMIGTACALRGRKQVEHLFEAAARLKTPNLRVVVAGGPVPGEEVYAAELIRAGKEKLGDRLLPLGHLNELRGLYNALDVFVNTSQAEACSISIIESLACGCPVVGYPSISVDEQVLPSGGEIVEQDRIDLLAAALERWLADPKQLADARARARGRAEEAFDIRTLSDQLWEEYHAVLGRNGKAVLTPTLNC